jgi:molecular chaperone GrpE
MAHEQERHGRGEPAAPAAATAAAEHEEQAGAAPASDGSEEPRAGSEVDQDLDELIARAGKADEYLALAQRTQADFENFRKRMTRDVAAAEARGVARLARELLPALDNLGRALAAAEAAGGGGDAGTDDHLAAGVRLVHADLLAALQRAGIESFSPQGERFDPTEHEAMAQHPVEGAEPGTIVEVYQQGFRHDGSVLRPARVVVAA